MTPPTITVGPSLAKILGGVTLATIAIGVGVVLLVWVLERFAGAGPPGFLPMPQWVWAHRWGVVAGLAVVLSCYRGIAVVGAVFWSRPRIEISGEGFTDYGVVGHRSRRWSDIEGDFELVKVGWPLSLGVQPVVAYQLTEAFKKSTRIAGSPDYLQGYDEAILISEELSISAADLADILNECKLEALGGTP